MSNNMYSDAVNYFNGLQSKMKKIMAEAEAIEAVDNANEEKRKVSGRTPLRLDQHIGITLDAMARKRRGECWDDIAVDYDISKSTLIDRVKKVKKHLEKGK